jgi:hypothetical protein
VVGSFFLSSNNQGQIMRNHLLTGIGASAVLLFAAACSETGAPTTGPVLSATTMAEAVGDRNENYGITPGVVNVCAFFTYLGYPDFSRKATFSSTATTGDVIAGNYEIQPLPSCIEVWNATSADIASVSASLVAGHPGYVLERIATAVGDQPYQFHYGVTSVSVDVSSTTGAYIWFKLEKADTPPPGGQGCTPGYWRQDQHFDSWTGYTPGQQFSSVFANAFPGKTLLEVVWMGGGGLKALGRHTVAALLNSSSAGVNYDLTTQQVIDLFNAAYTSGNASLIEETKNQFAFLNEQGCTIN